MGLLHLSDGDIEGVAAGVQDVPSSCQVDVCAVHNEGVALSHVALQAVESAVLGNLHTSRNAFSNKGMPDDHSSKNAFSNKRPDNHSSKNVFSKEMPNDNSSKSKALHATDKTHKSKQLLAGNKTSNSMGSAAACGQSGCNKAMAAATRNEETYRLQQSDNSRSGDSA